MTKETADGIPISDGFDFPVGPRGQNVDVFKTHKIDTILVDPDYFKSLGYWHPGEDWNGKGGGDTDLGDPIYAVSNGKVIDFGHYSVWGNIVLVEHALPDGTRIWSQYAHLERINVSQKGQQVRRGQQIGTMGKGDKNRYIAHLHFEIRKKKLTTGNWSPMVKDKAAVLANYYNPTEFIKTHRTLELPEEPVQPVQPVQPVSPVAVRQIVVDTRQSDPVAGIFRKTEGGTWHQAPTGLTGAMLWTPSSPQQETGWGEWRPRIPSSGDWEVWAFIPESNTTTTYARYQIIHADGQTEIPVNQWGNRNQWVVLGTFRFATTGGAVRLGNVTGELGTPLAIGFDAVCWTAVNGL